jgi:DNA-binding response OmpR family regulator
MSLPFQNNLNINTAQKIKILIADDNDHTRKILRLTFSRQGEYDVFEATQGIEAITVFNKEMPDIVFLDIMMPEMDGIEVCKLIKSSSKPHCFIIILSAKVSQTDIDAGLNVGADRYLIKPFSPMQLIEIISDFNKNSPKLTTLTPPTFELSDPALKTFNYQLFNGFNEERLETLEIMLGSQDLVIKSIKAFIFDFSNVVLDIRTLLISDDLHTASRTLHKLKGGAADIGANDVAAVASEIENCINRSEMVNLSSKIEQLTQKWQILDNTVKSLL